MSEYIKREDALHELSVAKYEVPQVTAGVLRTQIRSVVNAIPAADVEPVVRCVKCKYGTPLKRNACDVHGLHCAIGRGEEVRNVWHKYSKHYEDYSLVDVDGFCDQGEAGEPTMERSGSGDK